MRTPAALALLLLLSAFPACSAERDVVVSQQAAFRVVTVAEELDHPWSIAFLPGGDFLVTERRGKLLRIKPDGTIQNIGGVPPVHARGQGGLLDIVLAPDFAQSGLVYFSYAGPAEGKTNTELAVARLDLTKNRLEDMRVLFRAEPKKDGHNHYGGKILFVPDGTLFLTLGERFDYRDEAQNLSHHLGKIVHLNKDGSPAKDNPFIGRHDAMPEIYTYGNRNVQGIALQPGTKRVWFHEHGPRGGDEVNIIKPGANYGWPKVTFGIDYSGAVISFKSEAPGIEPPVIHWTPSIAPSGMAFYNGDRFPQWKGDLFVGALAGEHLRRLEINGDKITGQEVLLADMGERIRDVREGPDGFLYLVTDSSEGRLLRLEPAEP